VEEDSIWHERLSTRNESGWIIGKFRCEIRERFWCGAKWYSRENRSFSFEGLRATVPKALYSITTASIDRYYKRCEHMYAIPNRALFVASQARLLIQLSAERLLADSGQRRDNRSPKKYNNNNADAKYPPLVSYEFTRHSPSSLCPPFSVYRSLVSSASAPPALARFAGIRSFSALVRCRHSTAPGV
jgi:hypothetical protein